MKRVDVTFSLVSGNTWRIIAHTDAGREWFKHIDRSGKLEAQCTHAGVMALIAQMHDSDLSVVIDRGGK